MPVIYADAVFVENLVIDYVLLIAASRISGVPARRWRAAVAAAFGGVYALVCAMEPDSFLAGLFAKLTVGLLMVVAVFGLRARLLRVAIIFFGVSAAFAGAVMASFLVRGRDVSLSSGVTFGTLMLSFAVFYALFTVVFRAAARHRVRGEIVRLTVTLRSRSVTFPALADTGNGLREPVSDLPITICSLDALASLFDPDVLAILRSCPDPVQAMEELNAIRVHTFFLVPYRTVGNPGGMLLAFRPDGVRAGLRELSTLIALDAGGLDTGAGYCAVTNA